MSGFQVGQELNRDIFQKRSQRVILATKVAKSLLAKGSLTADQIDLSL